MILAILAAAAGLSQPYETTVGKWQVTCVSDAPSDDGQYDRCEMRKVMSGVNVRGATIVANRDATGISFTAKVPGCDMPDGHPHVFMPIDLVNAPDADKKLIGAQFLVMGAVAGYCPTSGARVVDMGGPELRDLLTATSKIRPKAANAQTH